MRMFDFQEEIAQKMKEYSHTTSKSSSSVQKSISSLYNSPNPKFTLTGKNETQKFLNLKNLNKLKFQETDLQHENLENFTDFRNFRGSKNSYRLDFESFQRKKYGFKEENSQEKISKNQGLDSSRELNFANMSTLGHKQSLKSVKYGLGEDTEGYYSSRRNSKFEEMMKITFSQGSPRTKTGGNFNFTINSFYNSDDSDHEDIKNRTIDIIDCTRGSKNDTFSKTQNDPTFKQSYYIPAQTLRSNKSSRRRRPPMPKNRKSSKKQQELKKVACGVENQKKMDFNGRSMSLNLKLDFSGLPTPQIYSIGGGGAGVDDHPVYLSSERNNNSTKNQTSSIKPKSKSYSKLSEIIKIGSKHFKTDHQHQTNPSIRSNSCINFKPPSSQTILKFIQKVKNNIPQPPPTFNDTLNKKYHHIGNRLDRRRPELSLKHSKKVDNLNKSSNLMIRSHIEATPLSQRYLDLCTHRERRQNSLRSILNASVTQNDEYKGGIGGKSQSLAKIKMSQKQPQKSILSMLKAKKRKMTQSARHFNTQTIKKKQSGSRFDEFMQKTKKQNRSVVQMYKELKDRSLRILTTFRDTNTLKSTSRGLGSSQKDIPTAYKRTLTTPDQFNSTKKLRNLCGLISAEKLSTGVKTDRIGSKVPNIGLNRLVQSKSIANIAKSCKHFHQFLKKNSDLGDLSTLKKSEFLRNQVIKQWQIQEITQKHDTSSKHLSTSKFMKGIQEASTKKKNDSFDNFSEIDGEYNLNLVEIDKSGSNNSPWPSSNKKQLLKFSITPQKVKKADRKSSNKNMKILEYSEASLSYDIKRQSIASRLTEKLKELKSSSEKRRTCGVAESMFSKVSDHESIVRKLDYRNQDELTLKTPTKKKLKISQSITKFGKDVDQEHVDEEDDDDLSRYQIEISF